MENLNRDSDQLGRTQAVDAVTTVLSVTTVPAVTIANAVPTADAVTNAVTNHDRRDSAHLHPITWGRDFTTRINFP